MVNRLKKSISFILILLLLSNFTAFANIDVSSDISAAISGDLETGEIFYEHNIDEVVPIASTTKIMTYLVAREAIEKGEVSKEDRIIVSQHAALTKGSSFGLVAGEEITLGTLLDVILIVSGNDAAVAIAEHVSGSEEAFVDRMHETAEKIGLTTAKFINPNGMPIDLEETDQNFMSTRDLFELTRYIIQNYPDVVEITDRESLVITERNYEKAATNPLLPEMAVVDGFKTGYTDKAGLCLISTAPVVIQEDKNMNRRVISVIMGAKSHSDRINKSKELLEYGLYQFSKEKLLSEDDIVDTIIIPNGEEMTLEVNPEEDYYHIVKKGSTVKTVMNYDNYENLAPLSQGDVVGDMEVYIDEELIDTIKIKASSDVEKAGFFTRAFRYLRSLLYN
ncbi:MAG: D-alanyl-D-alanine carboxypeptidase family protein [Bacillota bacterium]|nr:D-alanyl-D-alanine carboxypeptidase family protein [Bacillota bacterium]